MDHERRGSDRRRTRLLAAAIAGLHLVAFGMLLALVEPAHLELGGGAVFGAGLGLTAYALGARHAFDADHIAAIDTVTRRMIGRSAGGSRAPVGVGFFFALGHSTVVFALALALAAGVRGLGSAVSDDGSALHAATGVIGPLVSGLFLLALGIANAFVLRATWRAVAARRRGKEAAAVAVAPFGPLARLLARPLRSVERPSQMFTIGLLFGLGFDTATEIALLGTAGAAAAGGIPAYAVACLPLLFAAGMTLFDTLNGAFMGHAYAWSDRLPERRERYDLVVTALTVLVAVGIGGIELAAVASERLDPAGPLELAGSIDLAAVGPAIAATFALLWAAAVVLHRRGSRRAGLGA